jgi:hypothetical protein
LLNINGIGELGELFDFIWFHRFSPIFIEIHGLGLGKNLGRFGVRNSGSCGLLS